MLGLPAILSKVFSKVGITVILIGLIVGGVYFYYKTTSDKIDLLTQNNAILSADNKTLKEANAKNVKTIKDLETDYEKIRETYLELEDDFDLIIRRNSELLERLGEHDLSALAAAKPGLVENAINGATENVNRCFEILSGSPLTEKERNAENGKRFNPECPWLFDSSD